MLQEREGERERESEGEGDRERKRDYEKPDKRVFFFLGCLLIVEAVSRS